MVIVELRGVMGSWVIDTPLHAGDDLLCGAGPGPLECNENIVQEEFCVGLLMGAHGC